MKHLLFAREIKAFATLAYTGLQFFLSSYLPSALSFSFSPPIYPAHGSGQIEWKMEREKEEEEEVTKEERERVTVIHTQVAPPSRFAIRSVIQQTHKNTASNILSRASVKATAN